MSFRMASARDCAPCQKWVKREGFVAFPKTMAAVGHLKRIRKNAFGVAGAIQETCSSEMLGGQGGDFLRGVAFWSMRSSGLLRWFWVMHAALRMTWLHFFVAGACRRSTLHRWSANIAKRNGTRPSALHSAFHFWRKSRRIACQLRKLRKICRIASFLKSSSSKKKKVSQICFVFKLAERQIRWDLD